MRKNGKLRVKMPDLRRLFLNCLVLLVFLGAFTGAKAAAAEKKCVITVTAKSSLQKVSQNVYASANETYGGYSFEYTPIDIAVKSAGEKISVLVEVKDELIVKDSLSFAQATGTEEEIGGSFSFSYSYTSGDWTRTSSHYISRLLNVHYAGFTVKTPLVKTAKAGFRPGKGNALPVFAVLEVDKVSNGLALKCRVRILNSKGKTAFQKIFDVPAVTGKKILFYYPWSGKASKGNSAKLGSGKFVPKGKYKAEICVYASASSAGAKTAASKLPKSTKKKTFTITSKGAAGAAALKSALGTVVMYTGHPEIDYMAEKMVQAAGVKLSMSDDDKVEKLYHYMTKNFKHIKASNYGDNFKIYYDLDKLKTKISQYDSSLYKKWSRGEIVFDSSLAGYSTVWNMQRRAGVCTDNATIFKILLAHVGVQAGRCDGYYLNRNGTKSGHTWNWVIVNGTKYYYDVDVEIINYGNGQGDYYWYKKSLSESKNTHEYYSIEKSVEFTVPTWQGW